MTGFEVPHGHAVAVGLALDVAYAREIGLLADDAYERSIGVLASLGFALSHPALAMTDELMAGLDEFREHLGGRLTITLIDGIGSQADVHEIDRAAMASWPASLAQRAEAEAVR